MLKTATDDLYTIATNAAAVKNPVLTDEERKQFVQQSLQSARRAAENGELGIDIHPQEEIRDTNVTRARKSLTKNY